MPLQREKSITASPRLSVPVWTFLCLSVCSTMTSRLYATALCDPIDECSCKDSGNGKIISLWSYNANHGGIRFPDIPIGSSKGSLAFNPCTPFTKGLCKSVEACYTGSTLQQGTGSGQMETGYSDGHVQFIYNDADTSKSTVVTLNCNPKQDKPIIENAAITKSIYAFTLTSKCSCFDGCPTNPDTSGGSSGLSLGSVLCLILFFVIIFYVGLGIVINKFIRNKDNNELFPHKEFWLDMPSLVKDGYVFTYGKIKGKGGQYESI